MNSTARDVLTMIGAGLQRGIIKSPDLEMMYSDGPKRVRLIDMVAHALESLPPAPSSAAAEQIPEPPRAPLTPLSAHPALAAAADYAEKCAAWEQLAFGTRAYYDALAACDAAWERIAAAAGVGGTFNQQAKELGACSLSRAAIGDRTHDRRPQERDRRAGEEEQRGGQAGRCDATGAGGAELGARSSDAAQHEVAAEARSCSHCGEGAPWVGLCDRMGDLCGKAAASDHASGVAPSRCMHPDCSCPNKEQCRLADGVIASDAPCLSQDGKPNHCVMWKCHEAKSCARGVKEGS